VLFERLLGFATPHLLAGVRGGVCEDREATESFRGTVDEWVTKWGERGLTGGRNEGMDLEREILVILDEPEQIDISSLLLSMELRI
jgi:hypothetical protein